MKVNRMNRVLLVWQEVPDSLKIYRLEVNDEILHKLMKCHGKLINCHVFDSEILDWLTTWQDDYLSGLKPIYDDISPVDSTQISTEGTLIVTGWVC